MPRGAKPGQGRAGRPFGSKNRKTLLKQAALAAAAADPDISPKDLLLAVVRDPGTPMELRLQAARIVPPIPTRTAVKRPARRSRGSSSTTNQ